MTDFSYVAVDKTGKIARGTISSPNADQLGNTLAERGLDLVSYKRQEQGGLFTADIGEAIKGILYHKISILEKIFFAQHLALMLRAGVPIIESVEILGSEATSPKFKKAIKELTIQLAKGKPLSSFMEKEEIFSSAHLAVLKSGEASGKVAEALVRISVDLKRDYQMGRKLKGAMAYPSIIMLTLMAVSIFVIVFVLPKVGEVFKQMNVKIPLPTRILLGVGTFLNQNYSIMLLVLLPLLFFSIVVFKFTEIGAKITAKILPSLPIVKKLVYEVGMARFIRALSSLLASGVSIGRALTIASAVFVSKSLQKKVNLVGEEVKKGVSMAVSFKKFEKAFGGLLVKMCSVGEKSGRLADILEELANFYEEQVNEKLENISTVIEPILMILVGIGVAGMIFSIVGPIYQMMGSLSP